jgi:hypothetical protein
VPPDYHIRLDAGFVTLRRDDSIVAPFAVGAAPAEVVREVEEDYRATGGSGFVKQLLVRE